MNQRMMQMIQKLCKAEEGIKIGDLAVQFGVSQKTVRNDINEINGLLRQNRLEEIKVERGKLYRLQDLPAVISGISDEDYYAYKLSRNERIQIAAAMLVNANEYITLATVADTLYVSRSTIINDLDDIKETIQKGNLKVFSHSNKGLRVEGKESDKRMFLLKLMREKHKAQDDMAGQHFGVQAGNRIVIQKIISEQEHVHQYYLTDQSFQNLRIYLGIMVNRNMQGNYIEVQETHFSDKYHMAQDILKYISQYCQINITVDEIHYLSKVLEDAHYMKKKEYRRDALKIQMLARRFIAAVSEDLGINLNNDYDFFENLSNHLESVFTLRSPSYPENSIVNEIIEDNPEILAAVEDNLPLITQHMKRPITKTEVEYITVHICAALERKKNQEVAFHVIVACHAGIGTSHLLLEKIKKHFNFYIVDIISSHEAGYVEPGSADFIISTVPLKNCKLDYVVVSPMLNDEDYVRVGNKIDALRNSRNLPSRIEDKELTAKGLLERIHPVIFAQVRERPEELMKQLRKVIRDYFHQSLEAEAEIFAPYLHHLLPADHIQLDVECSDWKDAIRKSAQKLLDLGYIEKRYIEAMIVNVEENGPYIVLSQGFAVPHEGLEAGSINVGMNLIRLKDPVPFGAEELDPVEFVCCLSAVDHKTHLKAFFNLVNMLGNTKLKQALRDSKTSEEAASVIEKYEYEVMG